MLRVDRKCQQNSWYLEVIQAMQAVFSNPHDCTRKDVSHDNKEISAQNQLTLSGSIVNTSHRSPSTGQCQVLIRFSTVTFFFSLFTGRLLFGHKYWFSTFSVQYVNF